MFYIVASMLAILVISALVVAYAAFADRGEKLPGAAWLGEAMERAKDAVPTIADGDLDADLDAGLEAERESVDQH